MLNSVTCVCAQAVALLGVGDLPDDHPERPGEAGRLGPHLHHLHPQRYHRKHRLRPVPALQS